MLCKKPEKEELRGRNGPDTNGKNPKDLKRRTLGEPEWWWNGTMEQEGDNEVWIWIQKTGRMG